MVPEGWKSKPVDDLCSFANGNAFKASDWTNHGLPIIRIQNLNGSSDFNYFSGQPRNSWLVEPGELLFAWAGTRGVSFGPCRWSGPLGVLNQHIYKVRERKSVSKQWLYYALRRVTDRIEQRAHGFKATLLHVQKRDITDQLIPTPPYSEQKRIASILRTWENAITITERLLANSEKQKKALMQQLLTGKKRLPGFDAEWQLVHLNEIADVLISPVDKKTVTGEVPVELCNYTDVYYNSRITRNISFMKATAKRQEISRFQIRRGDVLITKDSETPGDIAVPALVDDDMHGVVCGYHLAILRPKEKLLDGAFLNHLLSMAKTRYYFFTLATGATRFGLSVKAINEAQFHIPPKTEQNRIAQMIHAAEQETEIFAGEIRRLKKEKKALMQQLLTGKRRVKVEAQQKEAAHG